MEHKGLREVLDGFLALTNHLSTSQPGLFGHAELFENWPQILMRLATRLSVRVSKICEGKKANVHDLIQNALPVMRRYERNPPPTN